MPKGKKNTVQAKTALSDGRAEKRSGDIALTGNQVKAFRLSMGISAEQQAKNLGITVNGVRKQEERGVGMTSALALAAIQQGLKPWKPNAKQMAATRRKDPTQHASGSKGTARSSGRKSQIQAEDSSHRRGPMSRSGNGRTGTRQSASTSRGT
jgi:DNA-binding transcriptional regulator YiaG